MMVKECWSCGHFLIGGGCWKDGSMGEDGWVNVEPDHSCESWVPEETEGTIMGEITKSLEFEDYDRKIILDALENHLEHLKAYQKELEQEKSIDETELAAVITKLDATKKIYFVFGEIHSSKQNTKNEREKENE